MLIAIEKPFRIGHLVRVGGSEGTVEDVGFRSTRIRTPDNSLLTIPSSAVVNATVENLSVRTKRRQRFFVQVNDRVIFVLPRGAREVRLVSRAQSPTEARPWVEDRRRLGVRVKRIVLRGADELREVPVDHPDLTRGWWAVERDGQIMSRWTDGDAVLPLPAMSGNVMLEIHLAGSMIYAVAAVPADGIERRAA